MRNLTVLYDARCGFCVRCRRWLESQPGYLRLEFVPAGSEECLKRYPTLAKPTAAEELVVISDEGGVYRNERAWIMCLYALKEYREWSLKMANPAVLPYVRHVDEFFARRRHSLSRIFHWRGEDAIASAFQTIASCREGKCRS